MIREHRSAHLQNKTRTIFPNTEPEYQAAIGQFRPRERPVCATIIVLDSGSPFP